MFLQIHSSENWAVAVATACEDYAVYTKYTNDDKDFSLVILEISFPEALEVMDRLTDIVPLANLSVVHGGVNVIVI